MTDDVVAKERARSEGVTVSESGFAFNRLLNESSSRGLRCEPPKNNERVVWYESPKSLFDTADRINGRIRKDWEFKGRMENAAFTMGTGWGSGPVEALRDYMLEELTGGFDPFDWKAEASQLEMERKVKFFEERVMQQLMDQQLRDLDERERVLERGPDRNRLDSLDTENGFNPSEDSLP